MGSGVDGRIDGETIEAKQSVKPPTPQAVITN